MSEEILKTTKRARMACHLLLAFDGIRSRDGNAKPVLTRGEAVNVVLCPFKMGAARAFIERLDRLKALDNRRGTKGSLMKGHVFSLKTDAEKKLRDELKELADLLIQLFPPTRPT